MTTTIAVVNDAGSAGKTTTAVTLAAELALRGSRVLLVDLDSQANATAWTTGHTDHPVTVGDVLLRRATLEDATTASSVDGLQVLPAGEDLKHHRIELGRALGPEQRLRHALATTDHDVIILDCQAGAGELLPLAALVAADHALAVTLPSPKELEGLPRVEDMVEQVRDAYNPDLTLAAIVPCAVPARTRGRVYSDALDTLIDAYGTLVTPPVRQSVAAVQSYDRRVPLPLSHPTAPLTRDYRAVTDHVTTACLPATPAAQAC